MYKPLIKNTNILDPTKSPSLNIKLKWNKNKNQITSVFKPVTAQECENEFKGVYFIDVGNVTKSNVTNTWYVNLLLNSCVIYTQPQTDFRNEYL